MNLKEFEKKYPECPECKNEIQVGTVVHNAWYVKNGVAEDSESDEESVIDAFCKNCSWKWED